ncbi:MAG: hypothetical protein B7Y95_18460, partial [Rhizobiales bacterium 32-66-11]
FELARTQGLRLLAKRVKANALSLDDWDLVVIADGANSSVREYFTAAFGRADHTPYSLRDSQVVDSVLGLRVQSQMSAASSVIMTIAQQRYLFNGIGGDETLAVLVESRGWETRESGGPEIDVEAILRAGEPEDDPLALLSCRLLADALGRATSIHDAVVAPVG